MNFDYYGTDQYSCSACTYSKVHVENFGYLFLCEFACGKKGNFIKLNLPELSLEGPFFVCEISWDGAEAKGERLYCFD